MPIRCSEDTGVHRSGVYCFGVRGRRECHWVCRCFSVGEVLGEEDEGKAWGRDRDCTGIRILIAVDGDDVEVATQTSVDGVFCAECLCGQEEL